MSSQFREILNQWIQEGDPDKLLDVSSINLTLDDLSSIPKNIKKLDCSNNGLKSIISFPKLEILICEYNDIELLPIFPELINLQCEANKLKKIELSPNIEEIDCSFNNLESLPKFPYLRKLDCGNNKLKSLPEFINLEELHCINNEFKDLPSIKNLKKLDCSYNKLTSLPFLPNIEWLDCSYNNIKNLNNNSFSKLQYINYTGNAELIRQNMIFRRNVIVVKDGEQKEEKQRETKSNLENITENDKDEELFIESVNKGDLKNIKKYLSSVDDETLDKALKISALNGDIDTTVFFINNQADITSLNENDIENIKKHKEVYEYLTIVKEYKYDPESIKKLITYQHRYYKLNQELIKKELDTIKIQLENEYPDYFENIDINKIEIDDKISLLIKTKCIIFLLSFAVGDLVFHFKKNQLPNDINELVKLKVRVTNIINRDEDDPKIKNQIKEKIKNEIKNLEQFSEQEITDQILQFGVRERSIPELLKDKRLLLAGLTVRNEVENELYEFGIRERSHIYKEYNILTSIKEINELMSEGEEEVYKDNLNSLNDIKDSEETFKECHNKEDIITGDEINTKKGIVFIISALSKKKYIAYCLGLDQLRKIFKSANKIYEWCKDPNNPDNIGEPILDKPVYKLPMSGIYIDEKAYNLTKKYNTFVLKLEKEKVLLGSSFGVSQMHGEEQDRYDIYTLIPIHHSTLVNKHRILVSDILNFRPQQEDYNQYYKKFNVEW